MSEIFIETHIVGGIMRVTAIDAETGVEVVFQAPPKTPRSGIEKLAAGKLRYVLRKLAADDKT